MSVINDAQLQLYNDMVSNIKLKLQRPFSAAKITMLIATSIKFLGKIKAISGSKKKDLVLHAVREVVQKSTYIKDDEKTEIIMYIDTIGDVTIDKLVEFAEDAYTFTKNKFTCMRCRSKSKPKNTQSRALDDNGDEFVALKHHLQLKLQRPISPSKVIFIVAAGVKYIERYNGMLGVEKKAIVIDVVRILIQECEFIDEDEKNELMLYVDTFADETINYLVDFGQHMYLIIKNVWCK